MVPFVARVAAVVGVALLVACRCEAPTPPVAAEVVHEDAASFALARGVPFAELEVPPSSRPHGETPPARIPLSGWTSEAGTWSIPLPVRTRNLYFFRPSLGMRVVRADGTELPHAYYADPPTSPRWSYDAATLRLEGFTEAPAEGELFLEWPAATARERALNLATSGAADAATFARARMQFGNTSRQGLLLPAPGRAAWKVVVPPKGELRFGAGLVLPEVIDGPASDGATLVVEVDHGGATKELWRGELRPGADDAFAGVVVDLAELAGKEVVLRARSEPGADARFDYVFLADPILATRREHPRRVFLVFVDTLRADHVGAWGYERPTTPRLDALIGEGTRFANARSVAPWTLPSARTMLSGRDPEDWDQARTLQGRLADAGFSTAMFAGNIYLTDNFGITRDWGLHETVLLPRAEPQVDRALAWLEAQRGRDVFMLLHLMDCHLPYEEPPSYRSMFAGELPEGFRGPKFVRQAVMSAHLDEAGRQYVRDRYDSSLRYVDDQLARLWEVLTPEDTVVFVSDHGEEFWDHDGFEHGHALWDELLRVPLAVRGPGIPVGAVVDEPVSMLDVTPTILDLVGLPTEGTKGRSLVALARGDEDARAALRGRDLAFGRPLYGRERWGVLKGDLKYHVVGAREDVYDLGVDPGETTSLEARAELIPGLREAMGRALGREVVVAYRLSPRAARRVDEDLVVDVTVPGGVRAAWVGDDPTEASFGEVSWDGTSDRFTASWPAPFRGSRDIWFVPVAPPEEVTRELRLHATSGGAVEDLVVPNGKPLALTPGERGVPLVKRAVGGRELELAFGVTPLPPAQGGHLSGHSPDLAEQLEAMGYVTGDKGAGKDAGGR